MRIYSICPIFIPGQRFVVALILLCSLQTTRAASTSFTYQGQLTDHGSPANGNYDFRVSVHDHISAGNLVAGPLEVGDIGVASGLFTLPIDFGANVFDGSARWLELGVRPGASTGAYINVTPRQPITATPYAIRAASFSGTVAASQISGTLAASNIGVGTIVGTSLAAGAAVANLNAGGQSGVGSGGMVLSLSDENSALVNAGYVRLGQLQGTDTWQQHDKGTPPGPRHSHSAVWTGSEMLSGAVLTEAH